MKATIDVNGNLVITPESELEDYALRQWHEKVDSIEKADDVPLMIETYEEKVLVKRNSIEGLPDFKRIPPPPEPPKPRKVIFVD